MRVLPAVLLTAAIAACSSADRKTPAADSASTSMPAPAAAPTDSSSTAMPTTDSTAPSAPADTAPTMPQAAAEPAPAEAPAPKPKADHFAPSLDIDPKALQTTASGLKMVDVKVGTGKEAVSGREVVVHYTGWLTNGKKFDSSRDHGEPFTFDLGAGGVIRGWDEGVVGMKVGGRRKLVIPADLGYGDNGAPPDIPPGATLVFDVELLEVH